MEWLSSWGFIGLRIGEAVQLSVGTVGADAKLINGSRESDDALVCQKWTADMDRVLWPCRHAVHDLKATATVPFQQFDAHHQVILILKHASQTQIRLEGFVLFCDCV